MKRRFLITVFSAMISAAGAVALSGASTPAVAQGIPNRMCNEAGLCLTESELECCYGQFSGGSCNTSWPPPCEECADDCCSSNCPASR